MNDREEEKSLAEKGFDAWVEALFNEEIDAEEFAALVILNHYCTEDTGNNVSLILALDSVISMRHYTPHARKKIKEQLKKLVQAVKHPDKTEEKKKDEIEKIILAVCTVCREANES